MNILETIVAHKRTEVAGAKEKMPMAGLSKLEGYAKDRPSLVKSIMDPSKTGIIAEFKRRSPSKGIINSVSTVEAVVSAYAQYGASGLSILTDERFFGGCLSDLLAGAGPGAPLLRKDFTIDAYQIEEARAYGASAILLIAACLSVAETRLLAKAAKSIGLEVLLELHGEEELGHVCEEVDMVGVNNRNLKDFKVDMEASTRLLSRLPKEKLTIAESGIESVSDVLALKKAGFDGFLIGGRFMGTPDPGAAFKDFAEGLK